MRASLTDRDALTRLLAEAVGDGRGMAETFLQALRRATRDLPLDERDDRFLRWLAGWDAETVAGVIRLLRLTHASASPIGDPPSAVSDLDTLPDEDLRQVVADLREVLVATTRTPPPGATCSPSQPGRPTSICAAAESPLRPDDTPSAPATAVTAPGPATT